jgi:predicted nucleic acid-binding protein
LDAHQENPVKKSAPVFPRTVIVDAGPLAAAINRDDPAHAWARRALTGVRGRFVTCEAAITEALHILENHPVAVASLRRLVGRMEIAPVAFASLDGVFDEVEKYAPRMDFADACAVVLARRHPRAFVLTTDFSDFSTYRVPFASPKGAFHN